MQLIKDVPQDPMQGSQVRLQVAKQSLLFLRTHLIVSTFDNCFDKNCNLKNVNNILKFILLNNLRNKKA